MSPIGGCCRNTAAACAVFVGRASPLVYAEDSEPVAGLRGKSDERDARPTRRAQSATEGRPHAYRSHCTFQG